MLIDLITNVISFVQSLLQFIIKVYSELHDSYHRYHLTLSLIMHVRIVTPNKIHLTCTVVNPRVCCTAFPTSHDVTEPHIQSTCSKYILANSSLSVVILTDILLWNMCKIMSPINST